MHTLPGVFYCFFSAIAPRDRPTTGMSSVVRLSDIVPGNYRLFASRPDSALARRRRNLPVHPIAVPAACPAFPAKMHMDIPAHDFTIINHAPGLIK